MVMNNIFRFVVIVVGIMLVITTGIIAYYLHTLSADIQYIQELNKQEIYKTYKQEYEYQCKRFYLFSDGKIDYLDKFMQDGWQVCSFVGVVHDADRTRGGEGHVYVVLRRPQS